MGQNGNSDRDREATVLDDLAAVIATQRAASPQQSYTAKLISAGAAQCAKKFGEEAVEFVIAAAGRDPEATKAEAADVLYHFLVTLEVCGVAPGDVYETLAARRGRSGLAEKAARKTS